MKAVILSLAAKTQIVDVSHGIRKFNVRQGAFTLAGAAPYFPKGTIHVAVVDPGVGTKRLPILIQTKQGFFVGPDNGILTLAAENQGITHIYRLTEPKFMMPTVSSTFHGRDIFAPAAAHLELGVKPEQFGSEIKSVVKPDFVVVQKKGNCLVGEVLHVDDFGNVITNISQENLSQIKASGEINFEAAGKRWKLGFFKTYAQAKPRTMLCLIGSHGFLEVAVNQGNAAKKLGVKAGDKIAVSTV
jgi:S-adenosyl-L-methionine hydrolase (adenosine-forming)